MRILLFLGLILLAMSGLLISNPMPGRAAADSLPVLGSEWSLDSSFGNGGIARFSVTAEPGNPEGLCAAELFDRDGMFRTRIYQGSNAEADNPCVSANGITPHPEGSFVWVKWIDPYFRLYKSKPGGAQDMAFGQSDLFPFPGAVFQRSVRFSSLRGVTFLRLPKSLADAMLFCIR